MSPTTHSLPAPSTLLAPSLPAQYLNHLILTTLQRKGFESAQSGAIVEMEHLLERHMRNLFETANEYAELCNRATPNMADLHSSFLATGYSVAKLRKEAKRRRAPIKLPTESERPDVEVPLSLFDVEGAEGQGSDAKPSIQRREGEKASYAWEGALTLPEKWTYAIPAETDSKAPDTAPAHLSSTLLDFIKQTATERGDIPPELGLVDYRLEGGGGKKKRKTWGVKGVGVV
ncbi:hypothetical protein P7C73_g4131, partial [Tremellales sp. Uapishka_1]